MNPRIFDVNAVCIKIGKYFTQADDTIKFLFELSISWFIIGTIPMGGIISTR